MHFRFIACERAVAVVSCKSYADRVDPGYAKKLKPYVRSVLLFAECCSPSGVKALREKAKAAGYIGFWHLYTYQKATGCCANDPDTWADFLRVVKRTVEKGVKR